MSAIKFSCQIGRFAVRSNIPSHPSHISSSSGGILQTNHSRSRGGAGVGSNSSTNNSSSADMPCASCSSQFNLLSRKVCLKSIAFCYYLLFCHTRNTTHGIDKTRIFTIIQKCPVYIIERQNLNSVLLVYRIQLIFPLM